MHRVAQKRPRPPPPPPPPPPQYAEFLQHALSPADYAVLLPSMEVREAAGRCWRGGRAKRVPRQPEPSCSACLPA